MLERLISRDIDRSLNFSVVIHVISQYANNILPKQRAIRRSLPYKVIGRRRLQWRSHIDFSRDFARWRHDHKATSRVMGKKGTALSFIRIATLNAIHRVVFVFAV